MLIRLIGREQDERVNPPRQFGPSATPPGSSRPPRGQFTTVTALAPRSRPDFAGGELAFEILEAGLELVALPIGLAVKFRAHGVAKLEPGLHAVLVLECCDVAGAGPGTHAEPLGPGGIAVPFDEQPYRELPDIPRDVPLDLVAAEIEG